MKNLHNGKNQTKFRILSFVFDFIKATYEFEYRIRCWLKCLHDFISDDETSLLAKRKK